MTNTTLTLRSLDIPAIHKFGIGFDSMLDDLLRINSAQTQNYPPYNIIKETDDRFIIELAIAGFTKGEIDVQLDNNTLIINGIKNRKGSDKIEYHHHGISNRDFVRTFPLAEYVEVESASIRDGILSICLERIIPEEKKPKSIAIVYTK